MDFQDFHEIWLAKHVHKRRGERKRRLKTGYQPPERMLLERVIYPVVRSFQDLHPEFEIVVPGESSIFLDIALIRGLLKIDFELDGFGPHARDISRYQFSNERKRDAWLRGEGWIVLRFSYDDMMENPRILQKLVRRVLHRVELRDAELSLQEREVLKFALSVKKNVFRVARVIERLEIGRDKTRKLLKRMAEKGILQVMGDEPKHVHRYKLNVANEQVQRMVAGL